MTTHAHNDVAFLPARGGDWGGRTVSAGAQLGPALVMQHLTKRFGARVAYDDVCFEVGYGEVFGFLGPNGAGNTTMVRTLAMGEAGLVVKNPIVRPTVHRVSRYRRWVTSLDGFTPTCVSPIGAP